MIESDSEDARYILQHYINRNISLGGYVNPKLVFHCNQDDPRGALSLSGVRDDELALVVLEAAMVPVDTPSLYRELHEKVLGRTIDDKYLALYTFGSGLFTPLIEMANHSKEGGICVGRMGDRYLIGSTHRYRKCDAAIKRMFNEVKYDKD